jgi:hypothetical protein
MDRYDRRPFVVRLGQQEARLQPLPVGAQRVKVALQVRLQAVARLGVGLGELGDLDQPVGAGLEIAPGADLLAQLVGTAQQRLRGLWIVPEVRIARAGVQLRELSLLGGQVKGAPPYRPRGAPGAVPRP